jgi:DNA invertase Pin-like site-specific DNA recombinase
MIPDTDKRVYGYARRSTDGQILSLDNQKAIILERAEREGWEVDYIFEETESGKEVSWRERPVMQDVHAALRPGDVLIVWQLERLDRDFFRIFDVAGFLSNRQVRLIVLNLAGMEMDLETPMGRMILAVMAFVADWMDNCRREACRAGTARLMQGELWFRNGGMKARIGKRWVEVQVEDNFRTRRTNSNIRQREEWDIDECQVIKEIWYRRMHLHHTMREIAEDLHERKVKTGRGNLFVPMQKKHSPKCQALRKENGVRGRKCFLKGHNQKCVDVVDSSHVYDMVAWYKRLLDKGEVPAPLKITLGDQAEWDARFKNDA